jgi:hypothetical protein
VRLITLLARTDEVIEQAGIRNAYRAARWLRIPWSQSSQQ